MAIKKLRVTFDVNMEMFLQMCQHSDMNIQAFSDSDPRVSHTGALPQIENRNGMRALLLNALVKKGPMESKDLKAIMVEGGYSAKSYAGLMWKMIGEHLVRRAGYRKYAIAQKGRDYVGA